MKSVLISIQPKWCELIASGEKTIEVRKTKPKLETPFKCYIYETKGKTDIPTFIDEDGHAIYQGRGQVIGEFVCDKVIEFETNGSCNVVGCAVFSSFACLSNEQIQSYAKGKVLYAWGISDLKIYDKPKELGEFVITDMNAVKTCKYRTRVYNNPDLTNNALLKGGYACTHSGEYKWCDSCINKTLIHAPQSYCYVKETEKALVERNEVTE